MMKAFVVLCMLLLFGWVALFAGPASAGQNGGVFAGETIELRPLTRSGLAAKAYGDKTLFCGKYFAIPTGVVFPDDGKVAAVYFESGNDPSSPDYIFGVMGRDKFITLLDDSKQVPSMTLKGPISHNDPIPFYWELRISADDLKKARPCVPEVKVRIRV